MRSQQKLKSAQGQILSVHQVIFSIKLRFMKKAIQVSKPMVLYSDINQEPEIIICTNNSEIPL
jgi:hypothetical protein